jgi:hypothetical protein
MDLSRIWATALHFQQSSSALIARAEVLDGELCGSEPERPTAGARCSGAAVASVPFRCG